MKFLKSKYFWIGVSLIEFGVLIGIYTENKKQLAHTFINNNGDFQWIAITSIVGILTFVFTIYNNAQANNVKVVTANKIKRNDKNRDDIASYIAQATEMCSLIRRASYRLTSEEQINYYWESGEYRDEKNQQGSIYENVRKIKETLFLSLPVKEKEIIGLVQQVHDDCRETMSAVSKIITYLSEKGDEPIDVNLLKSQYSTVASNVKKCNSDRKELRKVCSNYFDQEWKLAVDEYKIK